MNLASIPIGDKSPTEVNAVIEISQGSSNKVEYDIELGAFVLDRTLFSPLYYPCNYGFIPSTLFEDGDPLDILVLNSHPLAMGTVLPARPLGVLRMRDDKGQDDKIISVCARDPRYDEIQDLNGFSAHQRKEITHFFRIYKQLEEKDVVVEGWHPADAAYSLIANYTVKPRTKR